MILQTKEGRKHPSVNPFSVGAARFPSSASKTHQLSFQKGFLCFLPRKVENFPSLCLKLCPEARRAPGG